VAVTFLRCLSGRYQGARSYNVRGHVVDLRTFHDALCQIDAEARRLITYGERQIAIAYDLDDSALQKDLGPLPRTELVEGIRQTYELFKILHAQGRLDANDLV